MRKRSSGFDFAFQELNQNIIQQYRMRYILAKLTQFIEENAWGNPVYAHLDGYMDGAVHVEHILPQKPDQTVKAAFDKSLEYEDYKVRLGNLTLLEKTINTSISNGSYSQKKAGYQQSTFLLTRSLIDKPQVGANTQLNRAVEDLKQFQDWNSKAIEDRQTMLAELARKVWAIPTMQSGS